MSNNDTIGIIDLFCGIGGLTHGLKKAGLDVKAGIDFDKSCRMRSLPAIFNTCQ